MAQARRMGKDPVHMDNYRSKLGSKGQITLIVYAQKDVVVSKVNNSAESQGSHG